MCSLYCRVTVNGKRANLGSTHIEVNYNHWIASYGKVSDEDPLFEQKNLRLQEEFVGPIWAIYNSFLINRESFTADNIKRIFLKQSLVSHFQLIEGYNLYIRDFEKQTKLGHP